MADNFYNVFHYLKKENFNIDRKEFLFQVQSHPNYPSLLAITDTLSFFNIDNGVLDVSFDQIELLPNKFLIILKENINDTHIYFAEYKKGQFFIMRNEKAQLISKEELKSRWGNFVLFTEKADNNIALKKAKNRITWPLPFIFLSFFLTLFPYEEMCFVHGFFFLFPVLGLMFSIAAFKDLLGTNSGIINALCNISASTSCLAIMESKKWKIFDIINLSDLSVVFFSYQSLAFTAAFISNSISEFMYIQKILLLATIPVITISLYYQKMVEKKWCPICLAIISVIILELIFILTLFKSQNISTKNILISGLFFSGLGTIWLFLKPVFIRVKELSELQYEGARFMRNYQIFKTVLTAGNKVRLPQSAILLGNKDSNKVLTVITNPFCSPCKDVHEIVSSILKVNSEEIQINIIVNADIDDVTEENQTLLRLLIAIFMQKGESLYLKAMYDWYEMQNIEQWTKKYFVSYDSNFIDDIYKLHKEWCLENNFNATPSIFINGYKYPKTYPRKNLQFFINDIIEDEFVEENINIESKETAILYS